MLRQLFKSMVVARQASASHEAMRYMTNRQLDDIGFTRDNYIEGIKARISAELEAEDATAKAKSVAPVNVNLQATA